MQLVALLLSAFFAATATAAELTWKDVVVPYDPAVWEAKPPTDSGALSLTCIAPDCVGRPSLFGSVREMPPGDASGAMPRCSAFMDYPDDWRQKLQLGEATGGGIAFTAMSRWSGCRAQDEPILEACAVHRGTLYRLSSRFTSGCNFGPNLPPGRLTELLGGIRPAGSSR